VKTPFEFESFREVHVKGYLWHAEPSEATEPDRAPTPSAVVVLAHGMAETIMRYQEFAEFLVAKGMVVYGYSHRGHFETAGRVDRLGYIGDDGWRKMATDLKQVIDLARASYPGWPIILFGHSMGSYLVRTYLVDHPDKVDGIVLSGTGYPKKIELQAAAFLGTLERRLKGDRPSKLLDKLSFGAFNTAFAPTKTPFDWLSSDPVQVEAYLNDPWCGQVHPSSFFAHMAKGLLGVLYGDTPRPRANKPVPMLLMSGGLDPIGQRGEGVKKSANFYQAAGYQVVVKLYEGGRHEMLHEVNRQQVYEDLLTWMVEQRV